MQPDGFADLTHGRRVARFRRIAANEVKDLLLPLGQVQVHQAILLNDNATHTGVRTLVRRLAPDPDARKPRAGPQPPSHPAAAPAIAKHLESTALERLWRNW